MSLVSTNLYSVKGIGAGPTWYFSERLISNVVSILTLIVAFSALTLFGKFSFSSGKVSLHIGHVLLSFNQGKIPSHISLSSPK